MSAEIFSPIALPCSGRTITNRLIKVALYEHLAEMNGGPPNKYHIGLYAEWAKYNWGMIITGNVQVARDHLTLGRDIIIPEVLDTEGLSPFKKLAQTIHGEGLHNPPSVRPLAIMQISHVGRQSPNLIGGRKFGVPPIAPSPVRVGSNKTIQSHNGDATSQAEVKPHPYLLVLFQQPREMTLNDIKQVQQAFIRGALTAFEAGFDGIQLHGAHGYLLSQFLNPKTNLRRDRYSVDPENALRMLREITESIRAVVPKHFIIGMKINSADYVEAGERPSDERILKETQRVLDHIRSIALWGMVDFIEISGGDYESPDFLSTKIVTPRQAFFAQFAKKARECLKTSIPAGSNAPLILLTGGLRSPAHLQTALDAGHADLLGVGRGSILRPDIPSILQERILDVTLNGMSVALDDRPFAHEPDDDLRLPSWLPLIPLVGAGVSGAWYHVRIRKIAISQFAETVDGKTPLAPLPTFEMTGMEALVQAMFWIEWRQCRRFVIWLCCCIGTLGLGLMLRR